MPTYEYECTMCGHLFDVFHSMTAKPRVKCPECGGRTKKNIGCGAGIIFKGTGFYETDYKRKSGQISGKPSPSKPSDSKTESPKTDTAKTE